MKTYLPLLNSNKRRRNNSLCTNIHFILNECLFKNYLTCTINSKSIFTKQKNTIIIIRTFHKLSFFSHTFVNRKNNDIHSIRKTLKNISLRHA